MVKTKQDLTGMKFGRLTVIKQGEDYISCGRPIARWVVSCECNPEKEFLVLQKDLKRGHVKSCGCMRKEIAIKNGLNSKGKQHHKRINNYDLSGDYGVGFTGKGEKFYFDKEDYDTIKNYYWSIDQRGYVVTNINGQPTTMHRMIMNVKDRTLVVDHMFHNTTDNRKSQLRLCTSAENSRNAKTPKTNKSGVTGVHFDKAKNKWMATIKVNRKTHYLGRYVNKNDAINARKAAEEKYFKDFAFKK